MKTAFCECEAKPYTLKMRTILEFLDKFYLISKELEDKGIIAGTKVKYV